MKKSLFKKNGLVFGGILIFILFSSFIITDTDHFDTKGQNTQAQPKKVHSVSSPETRKSVEKALQVAPNFTSHSYMQPTVSPNINVYSSTPTSSDNSASLAILAQDLQFLYKKLQQKDQLVDQLYQQLEQLYDQYMQLYALVNQPESVGSNTVRRQVEMPPKKVKKILKMDQVTIEKNKLPSCDEIAKGYNNLTGSAAEFMKGYCHLFRGNPTASILNADNR